MSHFYGLNRVISERGDKTMNNLSIRSDEEIEYVVNSYANMLFRLCFTMLGNNQDAEDAVSEVLMKYIVSHQPFKNEEHRKAWLIKVATNKCRDMLRFYKIRRHLSIDDVKEYCDKNDDIDILTELLSLPEKYRTVIYLYYIVGYKTSEIAQMLDISNSAVRKRLQYGRNKLKIEYGKDVFL